MDIAQVLSNTAKRFPQKPAIIFRDQPISFNQLKDNSFKLANSLLKLGIKKADKVAIYLPNWPEYIYSYLAIWCCGLTAVPLDFMLTEDELVSCITHSQAKFLIAKSKESVSLSKIKENCPCLEKIILCIDKRNSDQPVGPGSLSFEELIKEQGTQPPEIKISPKDCAIIFYTSGSTGRPKGVLINYRQLGAPPKAMKYFTDFDYRDIALCGAVPFSHLGGLVFIQAIAFLGISVVLMDRFVPLEFLKNVQNYKVTCFWMVPSMYYAILQLKEFETFDLSSLKWINVFGAPSSADQLSRFHQYCPNAKLIHGWGMTETQGPTVTNFMSSHKIASIGKPTPWVQIKIFDETDKELPVEEVGELVVHSWVVSEGYYRDPQTTAQLLYDGWFHTGDLGKIDADGDIYIVGRKKEMIKVAGEIVFEPEVESAIHKHPDVAEVAVVGVDDKLRGEVPKAFVVLKEGRSLNEEELLFFLRQHLAHYKIPHYFEIRDSLPKTGPGKIDKEKLRKQFNARIQEN